MKEWVCLCILCIAPACSRESERSDQGDVDTVMVFTQIAPPSDREAVRKMSDSLIPAEPQAGTRFAIFSSLRYVEETGDAVGRELELWGDSTQPVGKYREAEGSLGCTHTFAIRLQSDSIQFDHPQYGTYHGLVVRDTIRGRFPQEVGYEDTLIRVGEPYRETRPCRR
jgi:hypothetical protein